MLTVNNFLDSMSRDKMFYCLLTDGKYIKKDDEKVLKLELIYLRKSDLSKYELFGKSHQKCILPTVKLINA